MLLRGGRSLKYLQLVIPLYAKVSRNFPSKAPISDSVLTESHRRPFGVDRNRQRGLNASFPGEPMCGGPPTSIGEMLS